jgi:transposase
MDSSIPTRHPNSEAIEAESQPAADKAQAQHQPRRFYIKFDPSVKLGDLLTTLSILVAIAALLTTSVRDRELRQHEQAEKVRDSSARTLAKLQRWQEVSISLFQDIQPLFVDTSEKLGTTLDVEASRDYLWKGMTQARAATAQKILSEQVENAYVDLYGFDPNIRSNLTAVFADLNRAEEEMIDALIIACQEDVLTVEQSGYKPAILGNRLRETAATYREQYKQRLQAILKPPADYLAALVLRTDDQLLKMPTSSPL